MKLKDKIIIKKTVKDFFNLCIKNNELDFNKKIFKVKILPLEGHICGINYMEKYINITETKKLQLMKPTFIIRATKYDYPTVEDYQILRNVEKIHNVDLFQYAHEINCSYATLLYTFSIFHEIGHIKQYINLYYKDEISMTTNAEKDELEYLYEHNIMAYDEIAYKYRLIPCEMDADEYSLDMLKRYKKEIKNIIEKK